MHEIAPLNPEDCVLVLNRFKNKFDSPVHFHPEYELNFISNATDAKGMAGEHKSSIGELKLVLVGSNARHGWTNRQRKSEQIHEITIQFHHDLIHERPLSRNMMLPIRKMLVNSLQGISFSEYKKSGRKK